MTIEDYFKEWEGFDFYTEMSDDNQVWRKGRAEKQRLKELAGNDPILKEIYAKFIEADNPFSGGPVPKLENYVTKVAY